VLDADDMTAACDVQTSHNTFLGVDAVRQAMNRVVLLVNVGEDVTADRACEDTVQGREVLIFGPRLRAHGQRLQ
jgi:hypothetical protein